MKLIHSPDATRKSKFTCEPSNEAREAAIEAILSWSSLNDLTLFAEARHGYLSTNSFCGITYPSDLDGFDRANGKSIPEGMVEANASCYGEHNGANYLLPEEDYLELLKQFLVIAGQPDLAGRIAILLALNT